MRGGRRLIRGRKKKDKELELDSHRLDQRIKQIAYGENTRGFMNLMKALERDPGLVKGCIPVKPAIHQKCSKRSWDGQVRKWRRALHMYDYVDFGESEEQSKEVREALVEQTLNPVFTPAKADPMLRFDFFSPLRGATWAEEFDSPFAPSPEDSTGPRNRDQPCFGTTPIRFSVTKAQPDLEPPLPYPARRVPRVGYSMAQLMALAESPLVAEVVRFPDALGWLDKRVDLEDDIEDEAAGKGPTMDLRSPVTQRFLGSPYDHAPITPRRLSVGSQPEALETGTPGRPWGLRFAEDETHDGHAGLMPKARPVASPRPAGGRRISLGSGTGSSNEGLGLGEATRTPLRQISRGVPQAKAATALKGRSALHALYHPASEKENLPPSLFCTPPRRSVEVRHEDSGSLYTRLVGFL